MSQKETQQPTLLRRPEPLADDPVRREALSQCCQMYRQLVLMRYYALTTCALSNAALLTLYFSYRTLGDLQNWLIRIVGGLIAVACIGTELRIARLLDFYETEMNIYADQLGLNRMIARSTRFGFVTLVSALSIVIYLAAGICWVGFATPPPPVTK